MGSYLSTPSTAKETHMASNDEFEVGVSCMQGWRRTMEDAHVANLNIDGNGTALYGVFDGHGGAEVARYVARHIADLLVQAPAFKEGDLGAALRQTYLKLDEVLVTPEAAEELRALENSDTSDDEEDGDMAFLQHLSGDAVQLGSEGGAPGGSAGGLGNLMSLLQGGGAQAAGEDEDDGEDSETVLQAVPGPNGGIQLILTRRPKRLRNGDDSPSGPNPERAVIIEPLDPPGPEASSSPRLVEMADDRDTTPEDQIKRTVAAAPSSMADDEVVIKEGGPGPGEGDTPSSRQLSYLAAGAKDEATFDEEPGTFTGPHAGCTAITAMIRGRTLVVANAGDSRCLLSHQGTVVPLSFDHKPTDAAENFRIVKAGGQVFDGRVNGSLNLSRALGDLEYKQNAALPPSEQAVTANPDILTRELQDGDEFLLLACDGIFDVLENQEAIDFIRPRLLQGKKPAAICEELCDRCLAPDTSSMQGKGTDNMSAMVVILKPFAKFNAQ